MSILFVGVVVGVVLAGLAGWAAYQRFAPKAAPAPEPVGPESQPAADADPVPFDPDRALTDLLQGLSATLDSKAERTAHPREMLDFPEFPSAVGLLADPETDLETVRLYALGRLWTLACVAFEALSQRADGMNVLHATMAQLRTYPPATLHFVLRYLVSLQTRPAVGYPLFIADAWWANHSMLIESVREYFAARQALGDAPEFGEGLGHEGVDDGAIEAFLKVVDHPFAAALIEEIRRWRVGRVDERALAAIGRFWTGDSAEGLVEPEPWLEALGRAEQAILGSPPRSILIAGGPRIGKSSFLKLLGARIGARGWRVFEATAAELMAGQIYIGQIEGRVRQVVLELEAGKKVAWCAGDLLQLARSGTHQGQSASVLDQIWPAVAAGRLVVLTESDPDGASRALQMRPSMRMHLELVQLGPFNDHQLSQLGRSVAADLQARQNLSVDAEALDGALQFGQQYLQAGNAPGVVPDILKRAAQRSLAAGSEAKSAARRHAVTFAQVVEAVAQLTGLPPEILSDDKPLDLSAIRAFFAERVVGQDEAIVTVVDRIAMLKAGLVDPTKPVGVFLFAGPTGTGKTELAKTLAAFLFGSPDRLLRLDMSEFQTGDSVVKIVGERGVVPGSDPLVERIRKQPFSVVLLDEFEKAHSSVWDLFLQVFDDGRLTDANGHTADFRHAIIILTSNLGAGGRGSSAIGFASSKDDFTEHQVLAAVARAFRPEFVNRLDRIVVFKPLTRALMYRILRKELAEVLGRRGLRNREWAVEWEPSALDFLIERGFSPDMGARPLKRAVDEYLLAPLAATLVEHRFPEGDQFLFVRSNGKAIEVEFLDPNADPDEPAGHARFSGEAAFSLPALILHPTGGPDAGHYLQSRILNLQASLESEDWTALKARLTREAGDPDIWNRPDRSRVFAGLNVMDRVREAAGAVEGLGRRLKAGSAKTDQASRDLVARLALQIWLTEAGVADALTDAPADAVVMVDVALEGSGEPQADSGWSERIMAMYGAWAGRRRMQSRLIAPTGNGPPMLLVSGFGAYRTLSGEAGLHVLENPAGAASRREIARVRVIEAPLDEMSGPGLYGRIMRDMVAAPDLKTVVRRYRERPSPLVRDSATGVRSGHPDIVLGGDFDLVFARPEAR